MLLHDWLVILTAQYNDACKNVQSMPVHIDTEFTQCPQLQPLPRLVFALLRNPLLRFHEEGVHPDYRIYLQCLFRYIISRGSEFVVFPEKCLKTIKMRLSKEEENQNDKNCLSKKKGGQKYTISSVFQRLKQVVEFQLDFFLLKKIKYYILASNCGMFLSYNAQVRLLCTFLKINLGRRFS